MSDDPTESTELAGLAGLPDSPEAATGDDSDEGPDDGSSDSPAWRAARAAALDHVLALIAGAPWGDEVVLRGSRVLSAWFGDAAREPADLDFVVLPVWGGVGNWLSPYLYVDSHEWAQQWPEAADGAARYEFWRDAEEQFETGGFRPRVPPEGLSWVSGLEAGDMVPPLDELQAMLDRDPEAAPGVFLDAWGLEVDGDWGYYQAESAAGETGEAGGTRIHVPWYTDGGLRGRVQLDFAHDERLPEPPRWTLIPSAHHRYPVLIQAAGREVSLAWKLLWLLRDSRGGAADTGGADGAVPARPQCKDLYDAVLLAEDPRTELGTRLLRRIVRDDGHSDRGDRDNGDSRDGGDGGRGGEPVGGAGPGPLGPSGLLGPLGSLCPDEDEWAAFRARHPQASGSARDWLERLGKALAPLLDAG